MVLGNVKMINGDGPVNIHVEGNRITEISSRPMTGSAPGIIFDNALVFPGLINSHDHLDFNLFPQLGDRIYNNYTEWGKHIHQEYKEEIAAVLKIPQRLRWQWGIYKNLLCGVTTVVNHGEGLGLDNELITVFENSHCLHSVGFEKKWKVKLNNPLKRKLPANIHVGEGSNLAAYQEIDELIEWNLLKKKLIGVHAVAMTARQAGKFEAVVWCPQSNYFLLDKTAQIDVLATQTNILFGTDSTLTSDWNTWNHLRTARDTKLLTDNDLYQTITKNPAKAWGLNKGEIAVGRDADLVVAKGARGYECFLNLNPADLLLVVHNGQIRLFDELLLPQLPDLDLGHFSCIRVEDTCKYVQGDLPGLMAKIKTYNAGVDFPVSEGRVKKVVSEEFVIEAEN